MKKEKQEIQKGQQEQKNGISCLLTRNLFWLTVLFLVTPLVFQVGSFVFNGLRNGDFVVSGDWLGFWGSYLGVLPSGVIAAAVAGYQVKESNKQSDQSRKQELSMMRNSKLIDYCYEMKGDVSKSIVILDSKIRLETLVSLADQDLEKSRYEYFVSENTANIFEDTNYKCLKKSHNDMYRITNMLANLMKKELLDKQEEYTNNLVLLERFLNTDKQCISDNPSGSNIVEKCPDIKTMKKQLECISKSIDETIEKLSA